MVKHLEEEMAQKFVRWDPTLSITALRFSNVMDPADYAELVAEVFPGVEIRGELGWVPQHSWRD